MNPSNEITPTKEIDIVPYIIFSLLFLGLATCIWKISAKQNEMAALKQERLETISSVLTSPKETQTKALLIALTEERVYKCIHRFSGQDSKDEETQCFTKTINNIIIDNPAGGIALAKAAVAVGYTLPESYQYLIEGKMDPVALASVTLH